jgi:two-component system, NtrC family, nitrogen regulation response regulator NtrX
VSGERILLVDDDPNVIRGVAGLLRDEGFRTDSAPDAAAAFAALTTGAPPAAVLLDLGLPGESGLQLLERLPRPLPSPVVVLSGGATPTDAVRALQLGATDFVEKPPSAERLLTALRNALRLGALTEERAHLLEELAQPGTLLGDTAPMLALRALIARVGPGETTVLIEGETGTGKERVARALHLASGRTGRLVAINCAALPASLLESELFGHERGAFTGATARRLGRFEQAQGGTLLLDEVGELPLELQAKLLRVLESREVERLGGTHPVKIDVRLVAATHRDLRALVSAGRFREDLWFRLAVFPLPVPPLRDRLGDLAVLLRAFAAELRGARGEVQLLPEGERALRAHRWPGNVRELRNFTERLHLLSGPGPLVVSAEAAALLGPSGPAASAPDALLAGLGERSLRELLEDRERSLLSAALERSAGNVAAAARLLKLDRGNLWRRLKALGLRGAGEDEAREDQPRAEDAGEAKE